MQLFKIKCNQMADEATITTFTNVVTGAKPFETMMKLCSSVTTVACIHWAHLYVWIHTRKTSRFIYYGQHLSLTMSHNTTILLQLHNNKVWPRWKRVNDGLQAFERFFVYFSPLYTWTCWSSWLVRRWVLKEWRWCWCWMMMMAKRNGRGDDHNQRTNTLTIHV